VKETDIAEAAMRVTILNAAIAGERFDFMVAVGAEKGTKK
jgi:hypothetical protein